MKIKQNKILFTHGTHSYAKNNNLKGELKGKKGGGGKEKTKQIC